MKTDLIFIGILFIGIGIILSILGSQRVAECNSVNGQISQALEPSVTTICARFQNLLYIVYGVMIMGGIILTAGIIKD